MRLKRNILCVFLCGGTTARKKAQNGDKTGIKCAKMPRKVKKTGKKSLTIFRRLYIIVKRVKKVRIGLKCKVTEKYGKKLP